MARKINIGEGESLRSGAEKINEAMEEVNSFQDQIDTIVVEGDSSVEAAQARIDAEGNSYSTLKERLDSEHTEVTSQLAQIEQDKADEVYVNERLSKTALRISHNEAKTPTQFIAHRGFSSKAPENTLPAFFMASEAGFDGIEADIQVTSDGQFIVIHDLTVDRTTDGTGDVVDMTNSQLRALDAGSWFNSRFSGHKLPTLEEYLDSCIESSSIPYLELKTVLTDSQMEDLVSILIEKGLEYSISIISFLSENLT